MSFLQNKKSIFFALLFFLFSITTIIFYINKPINKVSIPIVAPTSIIPFPTISLQNSSEVDPSYKKGGLIPTYSPEKGRGVDLEAPQVANSLREIQKLYPHLPYEQIINTPANSETTVIISDKTSQTNIWTLEVDVFGLDYRLSQEDSEYALMKKSFQLAVASINKWIKEKGVDPQKIMIIWGDKEYIQNKSQEWME